MRSSRSFQGRIRDKSRACYIFCAEDLATGKLAGASMIIARHGTPLSPHYYLQIQHDERYSHSLRKMFRHTYLRLRYSMDGPTELGGLVVDPALRGRPEKIGRQLSWARFLYIAAHPNRFQPNLIAEIMPPMTGDHDNIFWDHYGRRVTGLTFREADRLSMRDKEFIRALFPEAPLYTFLLPDVVRAALGAIGESSRGAVRLLEQAGLRFLEQIDPFDAGPYYGGVTAETAAIRMVRRCRVASSPGPVAEGRAFLVAHQDRRGFRAVMVTTALEGEHRIMLDSEARAALGVERGDRVTVLMLP